MKTIYVIVIAVVAAAIGAILGAIAATYGEILTKSYWKPVLTQGGSRLGASSLTQAQKDTIKVLQSQYAETLTNERSKNLDISKKKRLEINNELLKYGLLMTPIYDKDGINEYQPPLITAKKNAGCETETCCNGSGLWWCKAYVCKDANKGCKGCMGSCSNCGCVS